MPIETAVVFIIFNRPKQTEIVFEAIRKAKPKKLLVVADGPRFDEEVEKCKNARAVLQKIDWDCEVLTNFSDKNLGCGKRVSSGLDWVFSEVDEAIILEDDCLPAPSFFYFCQTLLEYYRHDERIMSISGTNVQLSQSRTDYSYYFSKYNHIWGWASWRRAWKHYDFHMKTWPEFRKASLINYVFDDPYEQKYWTKIFDSMFFERSIDTWDYMWMYSILSQNGLLVIPNVNLVSNIGFGVDATHTINENHLAGLPTTDIWKINHPPFIVRHQEADNYIFDYIYGGNHMRKSDSLLGKIRHQFSRVKNKINYSWVK